MPKTAFIARSLFAVLFVSIAGTLSLNAQQTPHFNHTTIFVVDLQKSSDFYEKVMQLKKIAEPFHDNRHTWFQLSEHGQLHVVQGAKETIPHDINIHLAFSVSPLSDFLKHLDDMHVKYGNWAQDTKTPQVRPDGVKQVYLQDPDGFWIEVNDSGF
jgi:lactoylglutathione lyase